MTLKEHVSKNLKKAAENYAFTMSGEDEVLKHDAFIEGAQWQKQKDSMPVSEELEEASKNYALNNTPWDDCKDEIQESFKAGAKWQKTKDESTTEDLGEYINELSKQFPEVSFAKLSRIAVRVAKWQKEQMIDKACEWLRENVTFTHPRKGTKVCVVNLNAFKEAMEE